MTEGTEAAMCQRNEPAVPAPLLDTLRHACTLANPSHQHIAIEDLRAVLLAVLFAAAGEGGHGRITAAHGQGSEGSRKWDLGRVYPRPGIGELLSFFLASYNCRSSLCRPSSTEVIRLRTASTPFTKP